MDASKIEMIDYLMKAIMTSRIIDECENSSLFFTQRVN